MQATHAIRKLVEKALYIKRLTPDIENEINYELTRSGHISDVDYEALELLMDEMDAAIESGECDVNRFGDLCEVEDSKITGRIGLKGYPFF